MSAATQTQQYLLPPALQGIVEEVTLKNTNYLTYNRVYSRIGSNNFIQSDPAVVHFGGFQLGQVYQQSVRIQNIHSSGTRIHVVPPSTPFFKAHCNNKRGQIAPGLDDVIDIEFCPQQWRYYYDCIRIHAEDENILIPIHAYPVMNETKFPSFIDFGKCALGDVVTKCIKMECKVPIDFEFEILELKPNPHIRVEPLKGVVPAHGHISIEVTFCPLRLQTEEMRIEVRVSEFNAQPIQCTITGSALPGLAKERMLQSALGSANGSMAQLDGTQALQDASRTWNSNKGGGVVKGGAGNGDAYTVMMMQQRKEDSLRDCRKAGPIRGKLPKLPPPPAETDIQGVYVPQDSLLLTQSDMAYVLNQEPGKLRIKDVKEAIRSKRAALEAQQSALDAVLAAGISGGVHPLERPDIPASVKEALFRMQLAAAEEGDKKASLGAAQCLGSDVMTADEVAQATRLRQQQAQLFQSSKEAEAATRLEAELGECGALHLPSMQSQASNSASSTQPIETVPEFRVVEGSDWSKRIIALRRFMQAVWRVIYRQRLARRLERIKEVLSQLGYDKQRLAEEAANPVLLVHESDRPGTAPTKHMRPENVRVRRLPLYLDCNFTYHGPVEERHYTDFDELQAHRSKVPLEYHILGYTPEEFPGLTPYAPPLLDQPLMEGAQEELPGPLPCGVIPPASEYPSMPDSCKQMPFVVLEIGDRYSDDMVYTPPEPSWGMDTAYQIQPRIHDLHESVRHEQTASGSIRALAGQPVLCDSWMPRRDTWQIQLTDEVIPQLMTGPDPSDMMPDSAEDGDKPALVVRVPTDAELSKYLPQHSASNAKSENQQAYTLVRQQKVSALEAAKEASAKDAVEGLCIKLEEYNKLLQQPCKYSLKL